MLLPTKTRVARRLESYRIWERQLLATPTDSMARKGYEDAAYTLCALMRKRCGREAAGAAESYLRPRRPQRASPAPWTTGAGEHPAHHAS